MAGSCRMIDEFAKTSLHGRLRRDRMALIWKLDGLSEYDARRPLTVTGTNLLGLVKHVASVEARYFGEVFDRPSPEPLPRWQDHDGSDLWAVEDEAREQIIEFYRRTWEHSDATIDELALDAASTTCRGGRSLMPAQTCSPSWFTSSARPTGMPGTPTSCAKASTAEPGCAPNMRCRSTRTPAPPIARRSSRPPDRPHQSRHRKLSHMM